MHVCFSFHVPKTTLARNRTAKLNSFGRKHGFHCTESRKKITGEYFFHINRIFLKDYIFLENYHLIRAKYTINYQERKNANKNLMSTKLEKELLFN